MTLVPAGEPGQNTTHGKQQPAARPRWHRSAEQWKERLATVIIWLLFPQRGLIRLGWQPQSSLQQWLCRDAAVAIRPTALSGLLDVACHSVHVRTAKRPGEKAARKRYGAGSSDGYESINPGCRNLARRVL